jgi:alkylhydroperoxidase/carboxymuconolactone decarboxylase family protein YurZ
MSTTIMPNAITTGTRRLQTLGAMWGLGASLSDTAQGMINEGYNTMQIQTAVDAGATDAQLQNLWNNYGAGTPEFGQAIVQLVASLAPPGSFIDTSLPSSVASVINTAFGAVNLADQAAWNQISSVLSATGAKIQEVARLGPKDPDVVQHVNDFNAKVAQFTGWYQQVFGTAPSNVPAAVTLGVGPLVIPAAIAAGVVVILAAAYSYGQWADVTKARLLAQTQQALITSGASPQQIAAILNPAGTGTNWSAWFQSNFGLILAALIGIAVVPPLLRRR